MRIVGIPRSLTLSTNRNCCAIARTCLGSDLRITNFAGGNTSSKIAEVDPLTGEPVEVLWVKGSGGDLGSIKRTGFATLYQEKLLALERSYKGADHEDDMVELYPLCAFRGNPVAASIDTPLHGFLAVPACGPSASGLGHCAGGLGQRQSEDGRVQPRVRSLAGVAAVAAPGL